MPEPEACRFLKSHEWVCLKEGSATVGISEHAQREITDVVFVELPKPGKKVSQGEPCGVIESVKAAFDIYAPVSGEVSEVNEGLAQDPGLVNRSPFEKGWLFRVKASRPDEAGSLMDYTQYQEFLKIPAAQSGH